MGERRPPHHVRLLIDENARLRGENLVTGIILTQLLQSMVRMQLNPHAFAARIIQQAQDAVQEFEPSDLAIPDARSTIKSAAMETVRHYDHQIRSVLPI